MNKKGTLTSWTEVILIIIAVIYCFTLSIGSMNIYYHTNYTSPWGGPNGTAYLSNITDYTNNAQNATVAESTIFGLNLKTFYVIQSVWNIMWNIITFGWITNLMTTTFSNWEGAVVIGVILQTIFLLGLLYATLRLLFRGVQP
jgi:hypothetical protein